MKSLICPGHFCWRICRPPRGRRRPVRRGGAGAPAAQRGAGPAAEAAAAGAASGHAAATGYDV